MLSLLLPSGRSSRFRTKRGKQESKCLVGRALAPSFPPSPSSFPETLLSARDAPLGVKSTRGEECHLVERNWQKEREREERGRVPFSRERETGRRETMNPLPSFTSFLSFPRSSDHGITLLFISLILEGPRASTLFDLQPHRTDSPSLLPSLASPSFSDLLPPRSLLYHRLPPSSTSSSS